MAVSKHSFKILRCFCPIERSGVVQRGGWSGGRGPLVPRGPGIRFIKQRNNGFGKKVLSFYSPITINIFFFQTKLRSKKI